MVAAVACSGESAADTEETLPQRWFSAAQTRDYAELLDLIHPLQRKEMNVDRLRACFAGSGVPGTNPKLTFTSSEVIDEEIPGTGVTHHLTRIQFDAVFTVDGKPSAPTEGSLLAERVEGRWYVVIADADVVAACSGQAVTPIAGGTQGTSLTP